MADDAGLRLEDVSVVFEQGGETLKALSDVRLTVAQGEFVTVIGSNGAGKSTLANVIAGSLRPTSGRVHVKSRDVSRVPEHRRSRIVARVLQDPRLGTAADLTVGENLALAASRGRRRSPLRRGYKRADRELFMSLLADYGRGLERKIDVPAKQLSGGQRQVVSLLMAGASHPEILLLDEHTSALDPAMADLVMNQTNDLVKDLGLTTVMVTHNLTQGRVYGDRLLIMDRGRVVRDMDREQKSLLSDDSLIQTFRSLVGGLSDQSLG